jgi:hypothetical protein
MIPATPSSRTGKAPRYWKGIQELAIMPQFDTEISLNILAISCFLGIAAAIAMRKSEGSVAHRFCTWLFYGCLLKVGLTAVLFIQIPSGIGLLAALTFGLMIIGTTWDFRASPSTPTIS